MGKHRPKPESFGAAPLAYLTFRIWSAIFHLADLPDKFPFEGPKLSRGVSFRMFSC